MSNQSNIKHVMRIAMVGIKPADQVMLKGCLRVLLRLDVDLEWVSANHPQVDLFMINEQFRHATNIIKLLEYQLSKPALYVSREDVGGLTENNLTLPLKDMNILNDWLFHNVTILDSKKPISENRKIANNTLEDKPKPPIETGQFNQQEQIPKTAMSSNQTMENSETDHNQYKQLISAIQRFKKGGHGVLQIIENDKVIAIVNPLHGLVWESKNAILSELPLSQWRIQAHVGETPPIEKSLNMKQWLWNVSWSRLDSVNVLTNNNIHYKLQYWPKPNESQERRDLLRVLTAIENKGGKLNEISQASDTTLEFTNKVVTGLLFSGYLHSANYDSIEVNKVSASMISSTNTQQHRQVKTQEFPDSQPQEPQTVDSILSRRESGEMPMERPSSAIIPTQINKKVSSSPEKTKKLGFLARLRMKLGL